MIQLSLTSDGLAAKTRNNGLIFTHFLAGSGVDENGEEIQIQKQIIPISFSQIYNAGDTYTLNGSSYIEQINHVKVVGTLLSSETPKDYTLSEIALMAKEGENGTEFTFAYGANAQSGINISSSENTSYSLTIDIILDTAPSVSVISTGTGVSYSDLITHINQNVTDTAHGIKYENGDLTINNVSLDICKNNIFQKSTGLSIYNTLPTASLLYEDRLAYEKSTVQLYKCKKSTTISIGDYVYEDNNVWAIGDGTENGALEVIADTDTPSESQIVLSNAQNHFMVWVASNNFDKRLSLVENVSLGGITDIINTLQSQITAINNSLSNPFPAWTAEKVYEVGDICIANTFKSYQYLECVVAGESGTTTPNYVDVGQMITDNEVKWIVCDFRDSAPVGTYKTDVVQRKGWLKANGAEVNRADYPRLWAYAVDNLLTTNDTINNPGLFGEGDGVDTFTLPNFEDYFVRYSFTRIRGTVQNSQMAEHTHSCGNQSASHTHTLGNQSANHKHSIGNQDTSHTHTINNDTSNHTHNYTYPNQQVTIIQGNLAQVTGIWKDMKAIGSSNQSVHHNHTAGNQSASHKHSIGNQDTSHTHSIGNQSASHKHTIGNTGSGDNTYPTNLAMQMYIKY